MLTKLRKKLRIENNFMSFSEIIAYGRYLPETLLKNEDLKKIAIKQNQIEKDNGSEKIIVDTDLLTIKIWSEFKYGSCDPEIEKIISLMRYNWIRTVLWTSKIFIILYIFYEEF